MRPSAACVHDSVCPVARERDGALAEVERLREALKLIRDQGIGRFDYEARCHVGDTGVPWAHWSAIAEDALSTPRPDWTHGGPKEEEK